MFVWGVSTSNVRRALAALVVLVLALGLSACGGDSESDEEKVEAALETALTSTEPAACGESRTISYMEDTTDLKGEEAEAACEEGVADREDLPTAITVSKVEVGEDGNATAEVAMVGGTPDGMVVKVALVEEDGSWKLDEFVDLVSLDREVFTGKLEDEFRKEGLGSPEVRCLVAKLDEFSQSDFEQLTLGEDETAINQISEECEEELEGGSVGSLEGEFEGEGSEQELEEALQELEEGASSAEYPRAVQQNFLNSCLATSGNNSSVCECSLDALEANYSVREVQQAEANIASGRMREMIETAFAACA